MWQDRRKPRCEGHSGGTRRAAGHGCLLLPSSAPKGGMGCLKMLFLLISGRVRQRKVTFHYANTSIMSIIYGLALFTEINEAASLLKMNQLSKCFL